MRTSLAFALLICASLVRQSYSGGQAKQQLKTFVVNGQSGDAQVVYIDGHEYVDLEALVRITNGSMSFQNGQTMLILPTAENPGAESSGDSNRLSRDFIKAGIEGIALMREWASPLATALQRGFPVTEDWVAGFQSKARTGLGIASAAVSTSGDQSAYGLLNNEFQLVQQWSDKLLQARRSMSAANYSLSPDALQNEPLSRQIVNCARFLGPMLTSGTFQDDASCH